ncbi:unannotated protein [freshwater metagenome]|uniref:Unannotated protein n=1 Tax=freshwater metagenome TaxID=449393 RepID=A0A6J7L5F1_9ZZZZ
MNPFGIAGLRAKSSSVYKRAASGATARLNANSFTSRSPGTTASASFPPTSNAIDLRSVFSGTPRCAATSEMLPIPGVGTASGAAIDASTADPGATNAERTAASTFAA